MSGQNLIQPMKHRIIHARTRSEYHQHIADLLNRNYDVVMRRDDRTTLRRKTSFDGVTFFLGVVFVGVGAAIYVGYWALARSCDEIVTVEVINLN